MCPHVQGREGITLDTVGMTPGAGFIRWGHPGVFGHAIPDAGSVRWDIPGDCVYLFSPDTDSGMWGHPGDCACEMQSAVSGEETDPGKCGHVSQCTWSGRGVTMETMNM